MRIGYFEERRSEAAADAAEIVAIKEIRSPVFAERQDERFRATRDCCQIFSRLQTRTTVPRGSPSLFPPFDGNARIPKILLF